MAVLAKKDADVKIEAKIARKIINEIARNIIPIRPDRKFERRKGKYEKNYLNS
ncbi:hypothetical protein [Clostridium autoethanogenum]|uniref:hypothetical protein n=1 Tax=Clostridium autoethanogenum TaxID=84023 RepID=UPI0016053620|nr:hypothetical protein [Clostridium autoethanogenum]